MAEVFAFVALRPCGCVAVVTTPEALADTMKTRFFRDEMAAGRVRTAASREEYLALPWKCAVCEHERKTRRRKK